MVMYKHALRDMCKKNGFVSFITTTSWMFLSSFEKLRSFVLAGYDFESLVDFGTELFEGKVGHNPIVAWVNRKSHTDHAMTGIRIVDDCYTRRDEKELEFFNKRNYHYPKQSNFSKIPGSPVAYWVSSTTLQTFAYPSIGQIARPRQGLATGCNDIFIRLWHEVNEEKVNYMAENLDSAVKSQKKWFPYNKGGDYRRWYGNNEYLVNWERDGFEIRHFVDEKGKLRSRPQNTQYYFHRCISWSLISSGRVAFRYKPDGHIFDVSGMSCFTEANLLYLLGLCNTPVVDEFLSIFSPTINFQAGDIANIPVAIEVDKIEDVEKVVSENIQVSKKDWDSYETSWDFTRNPLV